jgi:predicted ATPase
MHLTSVTLHPERYPAADAYPFRLPVLRETRRIEFRTPVTCFVGENGSGKSTLLEAIARRCGVHIWREAARPRVEHNRWEERLHEFLDAGWAAGPVPGSYFGAGGFRTFAELLDEWAAADPGQLAYFGGHSLLTLSHGQSLMAFFRSRYRLRGLYLLDEPEAALSPATQVELVRLLDREGRAGHAQFVIATHSPILLACPGAALFSFDVAPLAAVRYEETAHVRVYREFLADPARYLAREDPAGGRSGQTPAPTSRNR